MGLQNASENVLHGVGHLVIWPWRSFRNVFEIFLKAFARTLCVGIFLYKRKQHFFGILSYHNTYFGKLSVNCRAIFHNFASCF